MSHLVKARPGFVVEFGDKFEVFFSFVELPYALEVAEEGSTTATHPGKSGFGKGGLLPKTEEATAKIVVLRGKHGGGGVHSAAPIKEPRMPERRLSRMICEELVNKSERVFPFANLSVPNGREAFVVIDHNSVFIGLNLQFPNNVLLDLMVRIAFTTS